MTFEELSIILTSDMPSVLLKANEGRLFKLIPELEKCKDFNQHSSWHPYSVLEHIYHVVDATENNIELRLAALFHDIGKPDCLKIDENGVGHFRGHWEVSKDIFLKFAKKRNLDNETKVSVTRLIYFHDLPIPSMTEEQLNYFTKGEMIKLFKLKRADILAQNPEKHDEYLARYKKQEEGSQNHETAHRRY